jgi:plastocyanin
MTGSMIIAGAMFAAMAVTASSAAAASIEVQLKNQNFNPKTVTATPGDSIVFRNDDKELHSVSLPDNEALLATRFIEPHSSFEVAIPATADPAAHELVCTIHINMKGTLQIVAQ